MVGRRPPIHDAYSLPVARRDSCFYYDAAFGTVHDGRPGRARPVVRGARPNRKRLQLYQANRKHDPHESAPSCKSQDIRSCGLIHTYLVNLHIILNSAVRHIWHVAHVVATGLFTLVTARATDPL